VHDLISKAEFGKQAQPFGAPGKHRLGAEVGQHTGDLATHELPARARRTLEHRDPRGTVGSQLERCRESGDAGAHDDHVRARRIGQRGRRRRGGHAATFAD
jgi:hypothetical protein